MENSLESLLRMLIRSKESGVLTDSEVVTSALYGLIADQPLPTRCELEKLVPQWLHFGLKVYLESLQAINYEWQPPVIGRGEYGKYDLADRLRYIHNEIDATVYNGE